MKEVKKEVKKESKGVQITPIGVVFDASDDKTWRHWGVQFKLDGDKLVATIDPESAKSMIDAGRAK